MLILRGTSYGDVHDVIQQQSSYYSPEVAEYEDGEKKREEWDDKTDDLHRATARRDPLQQLVREQSKN